MVQLTTPDGLRGRVSGIYNLVFIGGGAIGGPMVGFLAQHFGARSALMIAGLVPAVATVAIGLRLRRDGQLRLVLVRTRSPWHQVPIRVNLQQAEIQLAAPKSTPLPRTSRPFTLGRRQHARMDSHARPARARRRPQHH
jgi:MFS family permease